VETERRSTAQASLETLGPARMWMLDRLRALAAEDELQTKPLAQTSRNTVYKDLLREHFRRDAAQTHREVGQSADPAFPEESEATSSVAGAVGCYRSIISQVCVYSHSRIWSRSCGRYHSTMLLLHMDIRSFIYTDIHSFIYTYIYALTSRVILQWKGDLGAGGRPHLPSEARLYPAFRRQCFVQAPGVALCMHITPAVSQSLQCEGIISHVEEAPSRGWSFTNPHTVSLHSIGNGQESAQREFMNERGRESARALEALRVMRVGEDEAASCAQAADNASRVNGTVAKSEQTLAVQASPPLNAPDGGGGRDVEHVAELTKGTGSRDFQKNASAGRDAHVHGIVIATTPSNSSGARGSMSQTSSHARGEWAARDPAGAGERRGVPDVASVPVHGGGPGVGGAAGHGSESRRGWAEELALSPGSPTGFFGEVEELIRVASSGHNVCGSESLLSQLACCDSFAPSSDPHDQFSVRSAVGGMMSNGQQQVVLEYDASIPQEVVITEAFTKCRRSPPVVSANSQDLNDWGMVGRSIVRDDYRGLGAVGTSSWYRRGRLPPRAPVDLGAMGPTKTTAATAAAAERGRVGAFDPQSFRSGGAVCTSPATMQTMQTKNNYTHTLSPEAGTAVEPISMQVVFCTPKKSSITTAQAQTNGDAERSGLRAIIDFTNRPRDEWSSANSQRILQARWSPCARV
jgi:hypothetical protein